MPAVNKKDAVDFLFKIFLCKICSCHFKCCNKIAIYFMSNFL